MQGICIYSGRFETKYTVNVPIQEQKPIILAESKRRNLIHSFSKTQFFIYLFMYLYCLAVFLILAI